MSRTSSIPASDIRSAMSRASALMASNEDSREYWKNSTTSARIRSTSICGPTACQMDSYIQVTSHHRKRQRARFHSEGALATEESGASPDTRFLPSVLMNTPYEQARKADPSRSSG